MAENREAAVSGWFDLRVARSTVVDNNDGAVSLNPALVIGELSAPRSVVIVESIVAGNGNGGIAVSGESSIVRSTIDQADRPLVVNGGPSLVLDSTIVGDGIAIIAMTDLTVAGSTIVAPTPVVAGVGGAASIASSVVVGSCVAGEGATVVSLGHNVVSDGSCGSVTPSDLVVADPLLGLLADNGGPTPTMLPVVGSPVLDRIPVGVGGCAAGAVDQRGVPRPQGAACDSGAVERD